MERSHSWSSAHAWKACVSQGTAGSNPALSAKAQIIRRIIFGVWQEGREGFERRRRDGAEPGSTAKSADFDR